MPKVRFETGQIVNFETTPTQQDIEEVATKLKLRKPKNEGLLSKIGTSFQERKAKVQKSKAQFKTGERNIAQVGLRGFGQAAGFVGGAIAETALTGARKTGLTKGISSVGKFLLGGNKFSETIAGKQWIAAIQLGAPGVNRFVEKHPEALEASEDLLNIADIIPIAAGTKLAVKSALLGAKKGVSTTVRAGKVGVRAGVARTKALGRGVVSVAKKAPLTVAGVAGGAVIGGPAGAVVGGVVGRALESPKLLRRLGGKSGEIVADVGERAGRALKEVPGKAKINLAETAAEQKAFKALPEPAKKAVSGGILARDAEIILKATPKEKSIYRKMVDRAKKFAENRNAPDPAEIAGNEFRKRIDAVEKIRKQAGKEMGEAAAKLSSVQVKNVNESVVVRLKKVIGLEDIELNEKGVLDFSDTTLSGSGNKAARKSIQKSFDDLQGKSPSGLHRFRQELFESLGGKKKGGVVLVETEERAINAMRQGMADSLDAASEGYKAANKKFAQIADSTNKANKFFKNLTGADDDILDMSASVLARRLTGRAVSGPQIKQLIRDLEEIAQKEGVKFDVSVVDTQNFYNAISRYYDITADTSFAGQVGLGTGRLPPGKKAGLLQLVGKAAEFAQVTPATQQKAIEELLK